MRVFVSCDMEGVAGVVDWAQCRPDGGRAYDLGCRLMLEEVNAAIDGAVAAGADEIVVNDSHGVMANVDPAAIRRPATYVSGRHKPAYMMQGLDASFDAIFFIGYHGSISGPPSVLSHTYNPDVISGVRLGGEYVGEGGINALLAHAYGVPIALVSGDAVTLAETASVAPDCLTVRTKESITRFSAHHLHPEDAREQLRDAAGRAVRAVLDGGIGPPRIGMPASLEVEVQTADMAEVASWVKGVQRSGERSVLITGEDGGQVFRAFVAVTYITRQVGGR